MVDSIDFHIDSLFAHRLGSKDSRFWRYQRMPVGNEGSDNVEAVGQLKSLTE
jgi:hypothetical protein